MKITSEVRGDGVLLLRLDGEMVGGPESEKVIEMVRRGLTEGHRHVLIDLRAVPWMSSGGIGVLTRIHTTLKTNGGRLKLLHTSDRIMKVLVVTGLIAIFDTYSDESEALGSFEG